MTSNNCGIYKITNTVTRKFYIGSSVNIKKRWACHRRQLSANTHGNHHLQNSWNKHGEDSFTFEVLEYCEKERLIEREQFYIDNVKPAYNISPTAGNSLGVKHTDETKRKMSKAQKGEKHPFYGKNHTDESKRKMSEAQKGGVRSDETRRKISEARKGKPFSKEHRRKLSEALKGKPMSEETRRKLSEASKGNTNRVGHKQSEETRRKISEAKKGEPLSEEHRRKISEALLGNTRCVGHKHTEETRRKVSEAMKRCWAERKANV